MSLNEFNSIFAFVCKLFFLPFKLLFSIEIVNGLYFGNILIYLMILILIIYIFSRPLRK